MDAFEKLVGKFLEGIDYWVKYNVKVEISKQDKRDLENPSMPRPEIDLVAFNAGSNVLLLVEAKSYLDSQGVKYESFDQRSKRYRLFTNKKYQEIVTRVLFSDFLERGLVRKNTKTKYALVAGKIYSKDEQQLKALFENEGWILFTPSHLKTHLDYLVTKKYENDTTTMAIKLVKR